MAFDPLLQTYDAGQLTVAADFLTHWLPFLGQSDGCSATLDCRTPGSFPLAISSSDLRGFEPTGWDPDSSPGPTGWDTDPESSSGSNKTSPPAELGRAPVVPTGWGTELYFGLAQTSAPTGWEFCSESTPVPTGWDFGSEGSPVPTGWITDTPVSPTIWDVVPETLIGQSALGEKVRISWVDMVQEEVEEARRTEGGWDAVPPERTMYGLRASSYLSGSRLSKPVYFVSAGMINPETLPTPPNQKMTEAGRREQQREQRNFMSKYSVKSFRMMANNGFEIGNGLGKNEDGIIVPVQIRPNSTRTGLGYTRKSKNLPDRLSPPRNEKYHVDTCEHGIIGDLERLQI